MTNAFELLRWFINDSNKFPFQLYNLDVAKETIPNILTSSISGQSIVAFWRGKQDCLLNLSPLDNPYKKDSIEEEAWELGFVTELLDMQTLMVADHFGK